VDLPPADAEYADHPFCGKRFAFTGGMSAMGRRKAMELVSARGGACADNVREDTDYLVLGQKGYASYRSGHKSSKMRKAEEMRSRGLQIEIMAEADFVTLL